MLWRFATYVAASGKREIQETIDRYDDYAMQAFSRQVAHLAHATKDKWHEPFAKKLQGNGALYEIRYKANNSATRALGFFGPTEKTFTITLICNHKQNVYKPPDAIETARKRAKQVEDGSRETRPLQVDGEDFPPHED